MDVTPQNIELIGAGLRSEFQGVFDGVDPLFERIATIVPSTSSGENYAWLRDMPGIREWIGDRQINRLADTGYRIENKMFEGTIGVKRTDIEDDKLGHYTTMARQLADKAAKDPDKRIFDLIPLGWSSQCFDGQNFFDAEHPVGPDGKEESVSNMQAGTDAAWYLLDTSAPLRPFIYQRRTPVEFTAMNDAATSEAGFMRDEYIYGTRHRGNAGFGFWQLAFGSKAPLTAANVKAAREAMESFKDHSGEVLGVQPGVLLVDPSNRSKGEELMNADKLGTDYNTLKGAFDLIVAPRLAA